MTDPYRIRSDDHWDQARDAYLSGETAESVCDRFNLGLRTFRNRAAEEGWRRADQPDPVPVEYADEYDPDAEIDDAELRRMARSRMASAARKGLVGEALRWARFADIIARQAQAQDRAARDRARHDAREQSRADHAASRHAGALLRDTTASARSLAREARTLMAVDKALSVVGDLHDVHDVHPVSGDTPTAPPQDSAPNRADRRRQLKQGRKRR